MNTNNQRESTQETRDFYPVVRPSNTCLLPRCGVPMDEGCTQPLSSDPMINLNTMVFFFTLIFSRLRGISTTWSLSPLQLNFTKKYGVRGEATHTNPQQNAHTQGQESSSKDYLKVLTRTELESLRMTNECAKTECG